MSRPDSTAAPPHLFALSLSLLLVADDALRGAGVRRTGSEVTQTPGSQGDEGGGRGEGKQRANTNDPRSKGRAHAEIPRTSHILVYCLRDWPAKAQGIWRGPSKRAKRAGIARQESNGKRGLQLNLPAGIQVPRARAAHKRRFSPSALTHCIPPAPPPLWIAIVR